jgi:MFS family permease
MILDIGVVRSPEDVGFYSGLIESIFSCLSFLTIMPCAYFSDRYGRKPIILFSITGLAISTALFGTSHSFVFMVITRCVGGFLGGSSSAQKTMLAELTDKLNQDFAFSGLGISYRMGQIIGQPIGGFLSHPARNWEFFRTRFWIDNPFSLPCFAAAAFTLVSVTLAYFFLDETLPAKRRRKLISKSYGTVVPQNNESVEVKHNPPTMRSVLTPRIITLLVTSFGMAFENTAIIAIYPLFAFTPIESGGLGLNEAAIGVHLAVRSFMNIMVLVVYPMLRRRFGNLRLYKICMFTWPATVMMFPVLNLLARRGLLHTLVFDAALFFMFVLWSFASMAWSCVTVMSADAAPSADAVAALSGITQMAIVLPQSVSPAFGMSLFAFSLRINVLEGNLVWVVFVVLCMLFATHSLTLEETRYDWREDYQRKLVD